MTQLTEDEVRIQMIKAGILHGGVIAVASYILLLLGSSANQSTAELIGAVIPLLFLITIPILGYFYKKKYGSILEQILANDLKAFQYAFGISIPLVVEKVSTGYYVSINEAIHEFGIPFLVLLCILPFVSHMITIVTLLWLGGLLKRT